MCCVRAPGVLDEQLQCVFYLQINFSFITLFDDVLTAKQNVKLTGTD